MQAQSCFGARLFWTLSLVHGAVPGKPLVITEQLLGPGVVEIPADFLPVTASLQPWKSSFQKGVLEGSLKY